MSDVQRLPPVVAADRAHANRPNAVTGLSGCRMHKGPLPSGMAAEELSAEISSAPQTAFAQRKLAFFAPYGPNSTRN